MASKKPHIIVHHIDQPSNFADASDAETSDQENDLLMRECAKTFSLQARVEQVSTIQNSDGSKQLSIISVGQLPRFSGLDDKKAKMSILQEYAEITHKLLQKVDQDHETQETPRSRGVEEQNQRRNRRRFWAELRMSPSKRIDNDEDGQEGFVAEDDNDAPENYGTPESPPTSSASPIRLDLNTSTSSNASSPTKEPSVTPILGSANVDEIVGSLLDKTTEVLESDSDGEAGAAGEADESSEDVESSGDDVVELPGDEAMPRPIMKSDDAPGDDVKDAAGMKDVPKPVLDFGASKNEDHPDHFIGGGHGPRPTFRTPKRSPKKRRKLAKRYKDPNFKTSSPKKVSPKVSPETTMKLRSSKDLLKAEALEDLTVPSPSTSGVSSMTPTTSGGATPHSRPIPTISYQTRKIRVKPVKHQLPGPMALLRKDKNQAVAYQLYETGLREVINSNIMTFAKKLSKSEAGGAFCVDLTANMGTLENYGMVIFPEDSKADQGIMQRLKAEEFRRIRLLTKLDWIMRDLFVSRIEVAERLQNAILSKLQRKEAEIRQATLINHYQSVSALSAQVTKVGDLTEKLERYYLNAAAELGVRFDKPAEQCDE